MQLLPVEIAKDASPRYDVNARALYVYIGATEDRRVAQTRSAEGIVFDCNSANVVVGIEVLVNAPEHLLTADVRAPNVIEGEQYDLVLDDEPDVEDAQAYDSLTGTLQVGRYDDAGKVYRLGKHVYLGRTLSGSLTVWISGLEGAALA